ncbi:MAG: winged helix-turn-helix transcriptional regulator [Candidatus Thorarchaeota archaeon]
MDRKDLDIISALGKLGGKVSAEQLSKLLKVPARTVRHRLTRLKESGHLLHLYALSHERKIGAGDSSFVMQENPEHADLLKEALFSIPWFYYIGTTYGTFNGYFVHGMFPMDRPETNIEILDVLKEFGLITDYYYLNNLDYETRRGDFSYFEPGGTWNWDWERWVEDSKKCIAQKTTAPFNLEYNPRQIDYDYKDILIVSQMKKDGKTSLKKLGEILDLSETQAKRRLDRLEAEGVIKGYRWVMSKVEEPLFILCYIEIKEDHECVLSCFYNLPFPKEIMMESRRKYLIRLRLPSTEVGGLLKGFDYLKSKLSYYTFQITNEFGGPAIWSVFDLYNKETNKWEFRVDDYIDKLRKFLSKRLA